MIHTARPLTITRQVQIDLATWTAGITRARRDYHAHPTRSCAVANCDQLADDGYMCDDHHAINDGAADRMRKVRASAFERRLANAAASQRSRDKRKSA